MSSNFLFFNALLLPFIFFGHQGEIPSNFVENLLSCDAKMTRKGFLEKHEISDYHCQI